jgi:hypothetical protein
MAAIGLSLWLGLAIAPTLGGQLLSFSPAAALLPAAGLAILAAVSALSLEKRLPPEIRSTPLPAPAQTIPDK